MIKSIIFVAFTLFGCVSCHCHFKISSDVVYSGCCIRRKDGLYSEVEPYYGDTGYLQCPQGRNLFSNQIGTILNNAEVYCNSDYRLNVVGTGIYGKDLHFQCTPEFVLYESAATIQGCERYWSLAYARPENVTEAAICYDWINHNLKSLHYISASSRNLDGSGSESVPALTRLTTDTQLADFQPSSCLTEKFASKTLLFDQKFEYHFLTLVDLALESSKYGNVFKIPFWERLYNQNWRLFKETFKAHLKIIDFDYEIVSGVSKELVTFQMNSTAKAVYKDIPNYIWTYLKALKNDSSTSEIVFVAYNSPYLQILDNEMKPLCDSKCSSVDWLQGTDFLKFHRMPFNGLIICCDVKDVADKLQFFPITDSQEDEQTLASTQTPKIF